MILLALLYNLRAQGVKVGTGEWLAFLDGLVKGLAGDLDGVYRLGRAVLVHRENDFDAYDLAFSATFRGVELPEDLRGKLAEWLAEVFKEAEGQKLRWEFEDLEALRREFEKRLQEQQEKHQGGDYWIGTGGRSPFGHSGRAEGGVRIGGEGGGGGAVTVADERRWREYRTDLTLDVRDFKVALRALRNFSREGRQKLDLDETIRRTARNAGDIDLAERPERINRMRLVLLMDTGGSMDPHTALVSRLFSAANEMTRSFKTFEAWHFHNVPYRYLYRSYETFDRVPTAEVLDALTPEHRLVWVGDASMAPWELFNSGWGDQGPTGYDWITRFARKCPASVWLNPDPERFWDHPTVRAIGAQIRMFPLTVDGLKAAVRKLRAAPGR